MKNCDRHRPSYVNIREKGSAGLPEVYVQIPFVDVAVPLAYVFYLLDARDERDMLRCICADDDHEMAELASVVLRHDDVDVSREALLQWLGEKGTTETTPERRARYMHHIMASELLPHQGLNVEPETLKQKKIFLGYMVHRLLAVYLGRESVDERDAYATKRVDTAGALCSLLFRQLFRHYLKLVTSSLQRCADTNKPVDVQQVVMGRKITAGLNYAFATGSWGVQKGWKRDARRLSIDQSQLLRRRYIQLASHQYAGEQRFEIGFGAAIASVLLGGGLSHRNPRGPSVWPDEKFGPARSCTGWLPQ